MVLRSVSKKKAIRIADKSVKDTVEDAIGVDISFIDDNGNEIEPKDGQHVDVSLSLNKDLKGSSFKVIHQKDNGKTEIISSDANSAGAHFATGAFSIYIIGGETAIATYNFYDTDNNKIISTQRVKNGDNLVKPKTPSKPGFKFTGWATAPYAQTPDFKGFGVQNNVAEATVSVYPVFKEIHYVFFMDSVGKDANPSRIIFTKEGIHGADLSVSDVVVPLDSTKKVISWHKDSNLSAESKVDKVTLDSENVTIYPNIKEGHYLTFDTGEGASYLMPQFVVAGDKTQEPSPPKRSGYDFQGWSTDKNGSVNYDFNETLNTGKTIYAVWRAKENTKYTVVIWKQSVNDKKEFSDNQKTYDYAESFERTANTGADVEPSHSDQHKDYMGFHYNPNNSKAVTVRGDGSTILNVYYDRNLLTLNFYQSLNGNWEKWNTMVGLYGQTLAQNNYVWPETNDYWQELNLETGAVSKGLTFLDAFLFDDLDAIAANYPKDTLNIGTTRKNTGMFNIRHYKQTADGSYSDAAANETKTNGGRFTFSDKYNGFTIKSYKIGDQGERVDTTAGVSVKYRDNLHVYYERNRYNLTFYNHDSYDTEHEKKVLFEEQLDQYNYTPERPANLPSDFKFVGWFKDKALTKEFDFKTEVMPAAGLTVYAKWQAPIYKGKIHLTIDANGDTRLIKIPYGTKINENYMPTVKSHDGKIIQSGTPGTTITIPEGNDWAGWSTKTEDGKLIKHNFDNQIYDDIELYPYYINKIKHDVKYVTSPGSGAVTDKKIYAEGSFADVQPSYSVDAPEGKVFLCWNDKEDLSGEDYYPEDKIKVSSSLTLYAKYGDKVKNTKLTYKSNYPEALAANAEKLQEINGTTDLSNNSVFSLYSLEAAGFNNAAVLNEYYFAGWKDSNTGKLYNPDDKVDIDNATENVLEAQWEKRRDLKIIITGKRADVMYTGKTQSVEGYEAKFELAGAAISNVPGVVLNTTQTKAEGKNVGTYNQNLTKEQFTVIGNDVRKYKITLEVTDGKLTIKPAKLIVNTKGRTDIYNGKPLTCDEGEILGLVNGERAELKCTGSQTYDAKIEITTVGGIFTYDGREHGAKVTVPELPEGYTLKVASSDAKAIDATGEYGIEAKCDNLVIENAAGEDVTDNLNIKFVNGKIVINPAELLIETPDAKKIYDGKPLTKESNYKLLEKVGALTIEKKNTVNTGDNNPFAAFLKLLLISVIGLLGTLYLKKR